MNEKTDHIPGECLPTVANTGELSDCDSAAQSYVSGGAGGTA